ncbi:MAG TPA: hypothetical protein VHW23_37080 [Kofleriaceae bacterium]|jgi:hypothetical protein|nr:hypothetical protein [Kofleriaceae bacterium]
MGVLAGAAAAASIALAACYSPALRDCTVSCGSATDCATGQVCGSDGMCASSAVAGRCATLVDAGIHDAPRGDAAPPTPDAGPPDARTVRLTVQIMGKGSVAVDGAGTCSSLDPDKGNCAYDVVAGAPLAVQAMSVDGDDAFAMWTSIVCAGQAAHCVFTPVAATAVSARFVHSTMHDPL